MFNIDESFLEELGLNDLPEDEKQGFLQHIYSELELRVGTSLSEGLSEDQLGEFESFIDGDMPRVKSWIETNKPEYLEDETFQQLMAAKTSDVNDDMVLAEYASLSWLALNRPDYKDVVARVLSEIKQEILSNRERLLDDESTQAETETNNDNTTSGDQPAHT